MASVLTLTTFLPREEGGGGLLKISTSRRGGGVIREGGLLQRLRYFQVFRFYTCDSLKSVSPRKK